MPEQKNKESVTGSSGYLYHKSDREPKSRGHVRPRPAKAKGHSSSKQHGNPAHEALMSNLRTFAVAALIMAFILGISFQAARIHWDIREKQFREEAERKTDEMERFGSRRKTLPPLPELAARVDNQARPEAPVPFDTESVRRALFLKRQADAIAQSGRVVEALQRYREALDAWPFLTSAWAAMGKLYLDSGDAARAQIALERAVENNPGSPEILNDLGLAHLSQGRIDEARQLFETAIEIDRDFAPTYFSMALTYLNADNKEAAAGQLRMYLRLEPDDARALKEQAFLDAWAGRYEDALASLTRAMKSSPEWAPLYYDAAAASALLGRTSETIRYLERAEAFSSSASVWQALQQPAFKDIRITEMGRLFAQELADRARQSLQTNTETEHDEQIEQ